MVIYITTSISVIDEKKSKYKVRPWEETCKCVCVGRLLCCEDTCVSVLWLTWAHYQLVSGCDDEWTSRFSSIASVLSVVGSPGLLVCGCSGDVWWALVGGAAPDCGDGGRCLGCPASRWWRWCSAPLGRPLLFYLGMGVWLSRDWMALMAVVPGRGHWVLCPSVLLVAPCLRLQCPSLTNQYTKGQTYTHHI